MFFPLWYWHGPCIQALLKIDHIHWKWVYVEFHLVIISQGQPTIVQGQFDLSMKIVALVSCV
jgi:hypothetical protein